MKKKKKKKKKKNDSESNMILGVQCIKVVRFEIFYTTIHRYPIFSMRYFVMCKVYTGYCGTSEIEHGLCAYTVDHPQAKAKARGLSLRTGAQTLLYLSLIFLFPIFKFCQSSSGKRASGNTKFCETCCTTDLCNSAGCGAHGNVDFFILINMIDRK